MLTNINRHLPCRILFIMVDGLGIPQNQSLRESIYSEFPALYKCLKDYSKPIDACLETPGTPQSATGQTAIFTGCNAAKEIGGHRQGFPNKQLREIIKKDNFYLSLQRAGHKCLFSNAYARWTEQALPRNLQSVTTVAANSVMPDLLNKDDLIAGKAVYHDLTREYLQNHGLKDVPIIPPEKAGEHLLAITRRNKFTVFEYFLTDHAGHRGNIEDKKATLNSLNRLFSYLLENIDINRELFVWTSDHGNIEETDTKQHTRNPVPMCAYGSRSSDIHAGINSITDIAPAIITYLSHEKQI